MKAITLWQPWASLIVEGFKPIETRTHDRFACLEGQRTAIHAGKRVDWAAVFDLQEAWPDDRVREFLERAYTRKTWRVGRIECEGPQWLLPLGAIIGTARVTEVGWLDGRHSMEALIDCCSVRRFGLFLRDVVKFSEPIPARGRQGIWEANIQG